jgi:hypothetical protein
MHPYREHISSKIIDGPEIIEFTYCASCPHCQKYWSSGSWLFGQFKYIDTCWYGHKDKKESDCAKQLKATHMHYKCQRCKREYRMVLDNKFFKG